MNLRQAATITVKREQQALQATKELVLPRGGRMLEAPPGAAQGGMPDALAYIKSYHKIRAAVGLAGWTLPFILVIGGWLTEWKWWSAEWKWSTQTSLSAYYHTSMGDIFITVLVIVGVLLVVYKLSDKTPDNNLGTWAGAAAFGVAFFPTERDLNKQPNADLSAIQTLFNEQGVQVVHFLSATALILLLARICIFFSNEELVKQGMGYTSAAQKVSSAKWSHVHRLMAYIIVSALVFVAIFLIIGLAHKESIINIGKGNLVVEFLKEYCILFGEAVAVIAFGASWHIKGRDKEILDADVPRANEP